MRFNEADKLKAKEISEKYGVPYEHVKLVIESPFVFIKEKTMALDLPRDLTREEFDKVKTNFNIPCLAKLYASYYQYSRINGIRRKSTD